jgi:SPP1 family predicted phage head-tail adaptor
VNAGELNKRGILQDPNWSKDTDGGKVANWTDVATVWFGVSPRPGRSFYAAQQLNSEITHEIKMRYRAGVRPDFRLAYNGRYFYFDSVVNVGEANRELLINAREGIENGGRGNGQG